jgi:hypothetical protein
VLARQACLGDLSASERRVLVLRAGVGARVPRSRAAVARRLRTSVRRVARLERSGLRRLRTLCGGTGTAAAGPAPTGIVPAADITTPAGAHGAAPSRQGRAPSRAGKADPVRSTVKPPAMGGVAGRSATNAPSPRGGIDLAIPAMLVVLGLAGFFAGRLIRRAQPVVAGRPIAPARPAAAPPPPSPPSPPPAPTWADRPPDADGDRPDWTSWR